MRKIVYSPIVKQKIKKLKVWLTEHFDQGVAEKVIVGILEDAELLSRQPEIGTNIADAYKIDTQYWYLFSRQHYLVYRIEARKIVIVQMFNEREDFMMKLFGISGRTQESIDYWGE